MWDLKLNWQKVFFKIKKFLNITKISISILTFLIFYIDCVWHLICSNFIWLHIIWSFCNEWLGRCAQTSIYAGLISLYIVLNNIFSWSSSSKSSWIFSICRRLIIIEKFWSLPLKFYIITRLVSSVIWVLHFNFNIYIKKI